MIQETSLLAYYNDVLPKLGEKQQVVLEGIIKSEDITNTELSARLNLPINCITPRVHELREKKLVIESQKRKCKITYKQVIAWKINPFVRLNNPCYSEEVRDRIAAQKAQPSLI